MTVVPQALMEARDWWCVPTALFDGVDLRRGAALRFVDGVARDIADASSLAASAIRHDVNGTVTPGLFDLQINGGGGTLLNIDGSPEGLRNVAQAHRRLGTAFWLPTVITDAPERIEAVARGVMEVGERFGVRGIHIEGPHLNPARRGTHAERFIRPLDDRTRDLLRLLRRHDVRVLLTLAPEMVAAGDIAELVAMGVKVSIGHSDADSATARRALDEGACSFTHLYNAMSPMTGREPGVVGTAINSAAYCGIICDGIHVADDMVGLAVRARPVADRMVLVSDAMPTVGGPPSFDLYGRTIHVQEGRLVNAEGALAGAHVSLLECVQRMVHVVGCDVEEVLRMAWTNPCRLLDIPERIDIRKLAVTDFMLLGNDLALTGFLGDQPEPGTPGD